MKKILALAVAMYASTAFAAISTSKHNMNNYPTSGVRSGDPCFYCHTAHNAYVSGTGANAPLWARNFSTQSYTFYSSSTVSQNLTGTSNSVLDAVSNACLSCHDGSIGVATTINGVVGSGANAYVGVSAGTNANKKVGPNLQNDHPIGITWNANYAGLTGTVPATFKLYSNGTANVMSCASCHLVHGGVTTISGLQFMRADPGGGSFCIYCHATK